LTTLPTGYLALVLHAHLPYVRHPEYADPFEERWFHAAVTECYLPLLEVFDGWRRDGVEGRLTVSLSPTLVAMFDDPLLHGRYRAHLEKLIELAQSEIVRTRLLLEFHPVARFYLDRFRSCRRAFEETWGGDLAGAFDSFRASGQLELITTSATHAFLPLLQHQSAAVAAQVRVGEEAFERRFGAAPPGLWNAEMGYHPGLDAVFGSAGLNYFFLDSHALQDLRRLPMRGCLAPVRSPAGVAAFARDAGATREVWSATEGYPGDTLYREYHRDAGHDLEFEYVRPYIHESGQRVATGFKYHRVTGPVELDQKGPYDPAAARARADDHARDFFRKRLDQCAEAAGRLDRPPLVTVPYDAELMGHWWYEGPIWLDRLMRLMSEPGSPIRPLTPSDYLARHGEGLETIDPPFSSWGLGGYAAMWLDPANAWIYPRLHGAADRMTDLARRHRGESDPPRRRALDQMARQLLLAQSSDWPFIMKTGTAEPYARRRIEDHLTHFDRLEGQVRSGRINTGALAELESRAPIFSWLRFEVFAQENMNHL